MPDVDASLFSGSNALVLLSLLGAVSFLLLLVTSYVKIFVVFGLLRSALGTPQLPPTSVLAGLSIVLTLVIMTPVFTRAWENAAPHAAAFADTTRSGDQRLEALEAGLVSGAKPVREFLDRHAHAAHKARFAETARELNPQDNVSKNDFRILIPSFLVSEITEAFQIGFLLFLPFLILDLLTANVLMALGMHMVAPTAVSLPLKLLLFVSVDGFSLLSSALMLSYA